MAGDKQEAVIQMEPQNLKMTDIASMRSMMGGPDIVIVKMVSR